MARAPVPEKTFPRGGKKPRRVASGDADFTLFKSKKNTSKIKTKKNKGIKKSAKVLAGDRAGKALRVATIQDLTGGELRTGMVVLGCVDKITDLEVQLSFPGNLRGAVSAVHINAHYSALIQKYAHEIPTLSELFEINDQFPVMILEKTEEGQFEFTLDPKEVNAKLSPRFLQKGMIVTGSVAGREEHGYVIDLGIPKVTAFLHQSTIKSSTCYRVGQLVSVALNKLSTDKHTVQAMPAKHVDHVTDIDAQLPIHCFMPGFRWKIMVTKTLKSGLEVALKGFGPDIKGYVHVNHLAKLFDQVSNYPEGTELDATLLYVLPVLNYPFFKLTEQQQPTWSLAFGALVPDVKVMRAGKNGLMGKITSASGPIKVLIPLGKINEREKIESGDVALKELYPVGTVLPMVRIERPSTLSRYYFAAIDRESLKDQLYSKTDLSVGQTVKCKVAVVGSKYCTVELSRNVKGFVPSYHLTDRGDCPARFKPGLLVKARVLSLRDSEERVRLTLKPSLLKAAPMPDEDELRPGDSYVGCVISVDKYRLVVEFVGDRVGEVPRVNMAIARGASVASTYAVGQVVKCSFVEKWRNKLVMSLAQSYAVTKLMRVGVEYKTTVSSVTQQGLYLQVKVNSEATCIGFMPKQLMSSYEGVASRLLEVYKVGDPVTAYCVNVNRMRSPPSLLAIHPVIRAFYKDKNPGVDLNRGAIVPCMFVPGDETCLELTAAVPHPATLTFQPLLDQARRPREYQLFLVRVVSRRPGCVLCSTSVKDVWDRKYMSSLRDLADYLDEEDALALKLKEVEHPLLGGLRIGRRVKGTCAQDGSPVIHLKGRPRTVARSVEPWPLQGAREVTGRIVGIDWLCSVVWVQPFLDSAPVVTPEESSSVEARVVYVSPDVVVADAQHSRQLVFIPTRRHLNDPRTCEDAYRLGETTKLAVHRLNSKLVGIDAQIACRGKRRLKSEKSEPVPQKKQKFGHSVKTVSKQVEMDMEESDKEVVGTEEVVEEEVDDVVTEDDASEEAREGDASLEEAGAADEAPELTVVKVKQAVLVKGGTGLTLDPVKQEVVSDEETTPCPVEPTAALSDDSDNEIKSECDSTENLPAVDNTLEIESSDEDAKLEVKQEQPSLDVGFDWTVAHNPQLLLGALSRTLPHESSSDEEEQPDQTEKKKGKRLTGAERKEKAREAEERLRMREQELVDPTRPPQSADDFDRRVTSSPDDSVGWVQYMSFHLQNTEIEKARAVARRALKVISLREEQEKLNVWFALLNLEQLYGTADSQKSVLDEALRCNDPYPVHIHKLNMLADAGAGLELERLGNAMLRKYTEVDAVWWQVGAAAMKSGKLDYARIILQRAMSTLPNSKHVALISRFAQLENKHGNSERAQTLYEHILAAFPKRVDVWSAYVDLMVKSNRIHLARQILERGTSQSLPMKKMKTLLKKFVSFEELHGTAETVDKVRQAAAQYLEAFGKDDD